MHPIKEFAASSNNAGGGSSSTESHVAVSAMSATMPSLAISSPASQSAQHINAGGDIHVHQIQVGQARAVNIFSTSVTLSTIPQALVASSSSSSLSASIISTEIKKIWHLPNHTKYFTGREAQLKEIQQKLSMQSTAVITQVIVGAGGVGKTQTALYYANQNRKSYPGGIWWFNAGSTQQLYAGYQDLAKALGVSTENLDQATVINLVKERLITCAPMLFVYDNASNYASIKDYLLSSESSHHPNIQHFELITSRNREFILETLTTMGNTLETQQTAETLAEELGYLPLALMIAVHSIDIGSINDYLKVYRESANSRKKLLQEEDSRVQDGENYPETVFNVWNISIEQIRKEYSKGEEKLAKPEQLIHWMAYLDSQDIPVQLFAKEIGNNLKEFLKVLRNHSLLTYTSPKTCNMHKLLQDAIRIEDIEQKMEQERLFSLKNMLVDYYVWDARTPEEVATARQLIPHCYKLVEYLEPYGTIETLALAKADILGILANALDLFSNGQERLKLLKLALPIFEKYQNIRIFDYIATLANIGCVLRDLNHLEEAQKSLGLALEKQEDYLKRATDKEKINKEIVKTLQSLGSVLVNKGKAKEAIVHLERALQIKVSCYGQNHPEVAVALTYLASALGSIDIKQQIFCLERAYKIEQQHDDRSLAFAKTATALGYALISTDAKRSKALFVEALLIKETVYRCNHYDVANTSLALGEVLVKLEADKNEQSVIFIKALKNAFGINDSLLATKIIERMQAADIAIPEEYNASVVAKSAIRHDAASSSISSTEYKGGTSMSSSGSATCNTCTLHPSTAGLQHDFLAGTMATASFLSSASSNETESVEDSVSERLPKYAKIDTSSTSVSSINLLNSTSFASIPYTMNSPTISAAPTSLSNATVASEVAKVTTQDEALRSASSIPLTTQYASTANASDSSSASSSRAVLHSSSFTNYNNFFAAQSQTTPSVAFPNTVVQP